MLLAKILVFQEYSGRDRDEDPWHTGRRHQEYGGVPATAAALFKGGRYHHKGPVPRLCRHHLETACFLYQVVFKILY
jgi:hypothetical protein